MDVVVRRQGHRRYRFTPATGTVTRTMMIRRNLAAVFGLAACILAPAALATAAFDDDAFARCTMTSPNPDGNFDAVVTTCCLDQGGTPTPSSYGLGCVGPVPDPVPVDYRPLIVMPTPPLGPEDPFLLEP